MKRLAVIVTSTVTVLCLSAVVLSALVIFPSCSEKKAGRPVPLFSLVRDFDLGSPVVAPPVFVSTGGLSDGLYAVTQDGLAARYELGTWNEIWKTALDSGFEAPLCLIPSINGSPTLLAAASLEGKIFQIDPATGNVVKQADGFGSMKGGLVSGDSGRVLYTGGYDGKFWKIDAGTLGVLGSFTAENFINGRPLALPGNLVAFGSCDANLYLLNGTSLDLLLKINAGAYIPSGPVEADGVLYFTSYHGDVIAARLDGTMLWTFRLENQEPTVVRPLVADGLLVTATQRGNVYALDRTNGALRWSFASGSPVEFSPIALPEGIVSCSVGGRLSLLDPATGEELTFLSLGEHPSSTGACDGEILAIGTETGRLLVISLNKAEQESK